MVTLSSADNALKTLYLGVLSEQLNVGVNPLLAKIGQTTADVWGKEIKKLAPYGVNGGVSSATESGALPQAGGNQYAQFTLTLKNFYGQIQLSDKAIRASQSSAGAFVNLLNAEMEGLLKSSKFNFGRMLFGDGTGKIATVVAFGSGETYANDYVKVNTTRNLMEGMIVDVHTSVGVKHTASLTIIGIDRASSIVHLSKAPETLIGAGCTLYVQGSRNNELTGLEAIFGSSENLYGLKRSEYSFLTPYKNTISGSVSSANIQEAIDHVEEYSGGQIDFIVSSYGVRRDYIDYLSLNRTNMDYMNLDGGYKAISYSGIPFVADRFVGDNTMYLLNSKDFKLHQLCDWRWIEGEGGTVLHQLSDKAVYSATLVKYADLLCEKPLGQAKLTFSK